MKSLKVFFAVLLTFVTLTQSKPSQAAVGAVVSAPLLIAGLVIAGGGAIVTATTANSCVGDSSGLCAGLTLLFGLPVIAVGLIMLDGEQEIAFQELNLSQASRIGVSEAELVVYNSEVDHANMLLAEVKAELSQKTNPSEEDSASAWSNVKDLVSPETFATMQKIVSQ